MARQGDERPFMFDFVHHPNRHALTACDPREEGTAAAPVPEAGVIRLVCPPTSIYVAVRQARLLGAWEARFAQALDPFSAILHGDAACATLERELESAMAARILAINEHEERMIPIQSVAAEILTATTDLWCLRHLLTGLQRALHAAPQPWDTLPAVRAELAPRRARLDTLETALSGRLAERFAFLGNATELRAGCDEDGILFVDVAYARAGAERVIASPWLTRPFAQALR